MRSTEEYWLLRNYLQGVVDDIGGGSDKEPILYFGALMALKAMNSKDADPVAAFERLRRENFGMIVNE